MGGLAALAALLRGAWHLLADPSLGLGIRLAAGGVFVVAGVHKLRRPAGTVASLEHFGLAAVASTGAARALGAAELLLGAALVAPPTARVGAAGCAVLSAAFTFLTARAYRRGEAFPCSCLSSSAEPVGPLTIARAAALLAGCAVLLAVPGSAADPAGPGGWAAGAVLGCLLAGVPLAVVALGRLRRMAVQYTGRVDWDGLAMNWSLGESDLPQKGGRG
ncbi:MauE/DoxX family redox-associated membrane protein [Dactylosporangium sp. CS-033363]|uniref:MauE/DoxX family redox-associated membrane protein n=1 Tax=Dactylosporangium sp. CS-033363 TaxID=3239935 RepID=UPI003D90D255